MTQITKEAIIEALKKLDHKNNALFTNDGLPIINKLGLGMLTRKQVTEAAPLFSRRNPVFDIKEVTDETQKTTTQDGTSVVTTQDGLTVQDDKVQEGSNEQESQIQEGQNTQEEVPEKSVEDQKVELAGKLAYLRDVKKELDSEIELVIAEQDKLVEKEEQTPHKNQTMIMQYIAANNKRRLEEQG